MKCPISIIIPVYNVEDYLEACLDSVLNQTVLPNEVILVDDGSTDRSSVICDEYADRFDDFITVIHKTNEGLSNARNIGVKESISEYIMFVDSDDTIENHACEEFDKTISNHRTDIITAHITSIWPDHIVKKHHKSEIGRVYCGDVFLKYEMRKKSMIYESVHCIYRRSFLIDNCILFEPGVVHEDQLFSTKVFLMAKSVYTTNIDFYNHIIRAESISTRTDRVPNAKSIIRICYLLECIAQTIKDKKLSNLIKDHCVDLYYRVFIDAHLVKHQNVRIKKRFLSRNSKTIKNLVRTSIYFTSVELFDVVEGKRRYYCDYKRKKK